MLDNTTNILKVTNEISIVILSMTDASICTVSYALMFVNLNVGIIWCYYIIYKDIFSKYIEKPRQYMLTGKYLWCSQSQIFYFIE